ncbi:MAG: response regulator [Planctomycetaceae bacterium]|nr:response regulator [Planctomycetaceae bacterium]
MLEEKEIPALDVLPIGIVSVDLDQNIVWYNKQFRTLCGIPESQTDTLGKSFYECFGTPEILGPDFCPFHTVKTTLAPTKTILRNSRDEYYQMDVTPFLDGHGKLKRLIISLVDRTESQITEQQFDSLMRAGVELADLTSDQLKDLTPEDRISLLKSNILRYTMDLLNYDVVEIRLLSEESGALESLLAYGIEEEAIRRQLYPLSKGNGVTGYVAHTGKSYLCEDTAEDPYYLRGLMDAKSSLTVPLLHHDQVIGTFNVESPEPRAFTKKDQRFLELFATHVASAINTLDLLSTEKAETAVASIEAIHSAVALPIDQILNDTVFVLSQRRDWEPELLERLHHIQTKAREIKAVIQKVGESMTPTQTHPFPPKDKHPLLHNSNILVVDEDESILVAANEMLARFGCNVESAPKASEALLMIQNTCYDAIIADIRMPDCNGYQFLLKLRTIMDVDPVPLILMTGFGYDPGHVIVNARREGVDTFLYKPFLLEKLLFNLERVIQRNRP